MTGPVAGGAGEFEAKLAGFVRDNRLAGAAAGVVHGDELAWSGGAGFADAAAGRPAGPDVLYRIASITKTFTGTAIMQLRDAGKLDLDDPVTDWLPELSGSGTPQAIRRVTIRRLLSHESGLTSEPPGTDWTQASPVYEGVAARTLERAAEIVAAVPPNTQLKYANLGYQLLGEIVHRASGVEFPAYAQREILGPLAMRSTAFEPLDDALAARRATGYQPRAFSDELQVAPVMPLIWAEGGLWSSVADVARWISCQLGPYGDEPHDSPVLAAASLREMHKPRYLADEQWTTASGITWYAVRKDDVTWVQHAGGLHGFSSGACFDREQRVGAVVLVNGEADAPQLAMQLAGIGRRIAQASPPAVRLPAGTPEQYTPLLGLYCSPGTSELRQLNWRDGKLTVLNPADQSEAIPLVPAADADTFVVGPGFRYSGETVRFSRLATGQVASIYFASATLLRLDPVAPEYATASGAAGAAGASAG